MRTTPAALGEPWTQWLRGPAEGVEFFARQPQVGLTTALAVVVALPPLVFVADTVLRLVRGAPLEAGDLAAGAVVALLLAAAVAWAVRERRRARALADGTLRVGLFLGDEVLLWRESPEVVWRLARRELVSASLSAIRHGKGPASPGELTLRTKQAAVCVPADGYPMRAFLDALARAWPEVEVQVDPALIPREATFPSSSPHPDSERPY